VFFDQLGVPVYFLLASLVIIKDFGSMFNSTSLTRKYLLCATSALLVVSTVPSVSAASEEEMAAKLALMEKRLAQLESRLSDNEQKTKEVKVLAASSNASNRAVLGGGATAEILSNSAWRNLRWTQEDQWKTVVKGATLEQVQDALGKPPRTVKSLRPQVDLVYFYETSIGDKHGLNGKVSFRKDKVIAVTKPDFSKNLTGR
jgi:hypothetical protein